MTAKNTFTTLLNFFLLAVLAGSVASFFLVEDLSSLVSALAGNRYFSPVFFLIAHVMSGIFILPSSILRAAGGSFLGLWYGLLINLAGVWTGAIAGYFIARFLGAEAVRNYLLRKRYTRVPRYMGEYGGIVVFVLRIIPVVPFAVINIFAGFLNIRFRTYLIATVAGSIPYTFIYTYFASSLFEKPMAVKIFPYFIVSFIALVLFLVFTVALKRFAGPGK